jgi:hypothetical protein
MERRDFEWRYGGKVHLPEVRKRLDMPTIWCPCGVPHQLWHHISQGADPKSP